jgi:hypothetical protein
LCSSTLPQFIADQLPRRALPAFQPLTQKAFCRTLTATWLEENICHIGFRVGKSLNLTIPAWHIILETQKGALSQIIEAQPITCFC